MSADLTRTAPGACEFGGDFLLKTLLEHQRQSVGDDVLNLALDFLQDRFAFLSL
jgi:hypothetical protein